MAARRRSAETGKADGGKLGQECHREETLAMSRSSKSDKLFDTVIGHIEDIIIDDKFQQLQQTLMEKYYKDFEDAEENKLIYTDIHKEYVETVEQFLETQLSQRMPNFNMAEFQKQLIARRKHLDGEVFDMLLTFTDFLAFKELVLDYKSEKEGTNCNFGDSFMICQPSSSAQTTSVTSVDAVPESAPADHINTVEPEPMRISLDFAKTDEEMTTVQEELNSDFDSLVITGSNQLTNSS